MKHSININVINNVVGIPASSDGVMMMFIKGVPIGNQAALNTAYLLTSLSGAVTTLGISAAIDEANQVAMFQQISEFYDNDINDGAQLWVVFVPTNTVYANYVSSSAYANLIRYTAMTDPTQRAKMVGLCYEVPTTQQSAADFPADVTNTIPVAQAQQAAMFQQGYQYSVIIDGYNMSSTQTPSGLQTMANKVAASVSLCITGTQPNGVSGVGLALGRFARTGIGHGFGEVADGPVTTNTAYLTNGVVVGENIVSGTGGVLVVGTTYIVLTAAIVYNGTTYQPGQSFTAVTGHTNFTTSAGGYVAAGGTPVGILQPGDIDALGTKQYLFLRTWLNRSGFYWNDGATCTDPSLQLSTQEYNRVANALSADALNFFIGEMGKNLPLDVATGNVSSTYLIAKQAEFYDTYISPLTVAAGSGDITDGALTVTGKNFNSTKTLNFTLEIVPTPILGNINGIVEFSSTL